jgi:glycosyltransferase involved in cell wall biosynthesis
MDAARPTRLVLLLQDLAFGGTQRYAVNLARSLDRALFSPEIWLLNAGDGLLDEARAARVPVLRVSGYAPGDPRAVLRLALRLRRDPPPLLYTLTVVPNIWGRLLGRFFGVPRIVSGFRALEPRQWEGLLWRLSDRILCNAQVLRQRMMERHHVPAARIAVVPNAVDAERFRPADQAPGPEVVSVARLVPDKNPLALLEAFALAARERPEARLTLAGEGPLRAVLEARAQAPDLAERVRFAGGCADVRPLLTQARVFALSSAREGSPNAVLEAMACGLPVAAPAVGGLPELVRHEETGLLAEPGDVQGLARHLGRLLDRPEEARAMGLAGRARVLAEHSLERMARDTGAALLAALGPVDAAGRNGS